MNSLQRCTCKATIIGLFLAVASGAYAAGVGSINSVIISHVFNDIPGATPAYGNGYPALISLSEYGVSKTAPGGINRDVWNFSNNGGASAYQFQNNDYFDATMSVQLTGSGTPGIDLEAGFLFSNSSGGFGGDLQFIVKGNGEIVQFGGPSFYGFSANDGGPLPNYVLGQTLTLGLNYVLDPNTGLNAFQYSVGSLFALSSPGNTYFDLGPGVGAGSLAPGNPLGGYFQIGNDPNNPNNFGTAIFDHITITPAPVPEPSTLAFLGLGIVSLLFRRRRI
jgi:hypothetical protein